MKKVLSLLLVIMIVLSLSACSNNEATADNDKSSLTHTHSYSDATCTVPAKCSCGASSGSALGHSYNNATCTEAQTCSRCGATEGGALGHSYSNATCTEAEKCSRCGTTNGSALGHNYTNASCTDPKTCKTCGKTEGTVEHKWIDATCTAPKTCSICKVTEGQSLVHNYIDGICSNCGKRSYILCKIGQKYKTPCGLDITLNAFTRTETAGYYEYKISYTLENNVPNTEIGEPTFKLFLDDGSIEGQYGFFGTLFYTDSITRENTWKVPKNKNVLVLEFYGIDSSADFDAFAKYSLSKTIELKALHWTYVE